MGRGRNEQTANGDRNKTRGEGTDFQHKERDISSRIAASATDFSRILAIFLWVLSRPIDLGRPRYEACRMQTTRRRFIKLSGAGALALAARSTSLFAEKTVKPMR